MFPSLEEDKSTPGRDRAKVLHHESTAPPSAGYVASPANRTSIATVATTSQPSSASGLR